MPDSRKAVIAVIADNETGYAATNGSRAGQRDRATWSVKKGQQCCAFSGMPKQLCCEGEALKLRQAKKIGFDGADPAARHKSFRAFTGCSKSQCDRFMPSCETYPRNYSKKLFAVAKTICKEFLFRRLII